MAQDPNRWAVNMASSGGHGRMWDHAYMLTSAGIMALPESLIRRPKDLRGMGIGVGYHSGSHYSCLQYLEPFVAPRDVKLSFIGGPSDWTSLICDRKIAAANMSGTEKDALEQLGIRMASSTRSTCGASLSPATPRCRTLKCTFAPIRRQVQSCASRSPLNDPG
jgi:NitT/TauT family transport system substrate-binding protein